MSGISGFYNPYNDFTEFPKKNIEIIKNMKEKIISRGVNKQYEKIAKHFCMCECFSKQSYKEGGSYVGKITVEGSNYYINYDGEIYNKSEILSVLKKYHKSPINSDSELILLSYYYLGYNFITYFDGVFSIIIYDENNNIFHLYRDRFGIKPLYYTVLRDTLIYSSKIDALFEYPGITPKIDLESFNNIFSIGPAKAQGYGVFKNINELLPGEHISYSGLGLFKEKYYKLHSIPHEDDYNKTLIKTEEILFEAIKNQTPKTDFISFLSGGLDSSIVTSIAKNISNNNIKTYSFEFEDNDKFFEKSFLQPDLDKKYVSIMVDYLKTDHTVLTIKTKDMFDLLQASVDSRCLPTMVDVDSSLLYFCNKVAPMDSIVLTGECSDEIFGGYPWFYSQSTQKDNYLFPWSSDISFRKSILNKEFASALGMENFIQKKYNEVISEIEYIPGENSMDKHARTITFLNLRYFMQTLLDRMDRTASTCDLTARVPFANYKLIEYVYNIPWKYKYKNEQRKSILAEIGMKYLPAEIAKRRKSPYPKSYNPYYMKLLKDKTKEIINDSNSKIRGYLNLDNVNYILSSEKSANNPWFGQLMNTPQMLGYIIQTEYWLKKYKLSL